MTFCATMQAAAQGWTAEKNLERDGLSNVVASQVVPVLPDDFPAAVLPGILPRFRALVKRIKALHTYTVAIGEALGIEGPVATAPDLTQVQPDFDATISGNHVELGWDWGGNGAYLDMCELQVDRNDGKGRVVLAYDTTPGYNDTQPFPATPTKWTYWAIYRVGDAQVGLWSKPVTITVSL